MLLMGADQYNMNIEDIKKMAFRKMGSRKEQSAREPGWLYYHGIRTANISLKLNKSLKANVDKFIIYSGAIFHDIGKGEDPHNETGANMIKDLLNKKIEDIKLDRITAIIKYHCQRNLSDQLQIEQKIVQDADLLDHVGIIVPWLAFYWSGTYNETIHQHLAFKKSEENHKYRGGMRKRLNFDVSIRIFDERIEFEDDFLNKFEEIYFSGI